MELLKKSLCKSDALIAALFTVDMGDEFSIYLVLSAAQARHH
jgi:hypothetical protein